MPKQFKAAITDVVTYDFLPWNKIRLNAAQVGTTYFANIQRWQFVLYDLLYFQTFVHELGHSLGMPHDYDGPESCRGHIMDYGPAKELLEAGWSQCSKDAIAGWFEQLSEEGMNCKDDSDYSNYTLTPP